MINFGRMVAKKRKLILVIAVLLLIPSVIGYLGTRINYDVLLYLPDDIETIQGQNILLDEFGKGGFSLVMLDGMEDKDVAEIKDKIEDIDHVESVIWYDSVLDISVPEEMLPESAYDFFNSGDTTMMAVFFDTASSADESIEAVQEMREVCGDQCYISGLTAFVTDLKELCEAEEPIYVAIAVLMACIVMALFMDSWVIPFIFLAGIGLSIIYNLGSNGFLGQVSYITKAVAAVLQLAVTMDYSIFLWHSYEEELETSSDDREEAMGRAIANTLTSVTGSSLTTIAGFLALCFMTFTLGKDLGIVMAKGVVLGVIGSVTILPSLILVCENLIRRTQHKPLMPNFSKLSKLVTEKPLVFLLIFAILIGPAYYGYSHYSVYYKLDESIPDTLDCKIANAKLEDEFDLGTTLMVLIDSDTSQQDVKSMMDDIAAVDGVKSTLSLEQTLGPMVPDEIVPSELSNILTSDDYELAIVNSEYEVASDEVNAQIDEINAVMDKYDEGAMLIGEAPCTKDLITITDRDFQVVSWISILAIFVIILFVLKSISLPVILVAGIEFAIFINLGIPYYTGTVLPFVAGIIISTIQLGSTVDYAILMTTRYKRERHDGKSGKEAVRIAHETSMPSVLVSALGFFGATFGVGLYSDIDIISSMCSLIGRGALISLLAVMFIVPAALVVCDKIIVKTSKGFTPESDQKERARRVRIKEAFGHGSK